MLPNDWRLSVVGKEEWHTRMFAGKATLIIAR